MKEMLTALESAIAAIDCSGPNGFTRPGTHIMQLLEKMKICNQDDLWTLIRKMDEGVDLIGKENAEAGRRWESFPFADDAYLWLTALTLLIHKTKKWSCRAHTEIHHLLRANIVYTITLASCKLRFVIPIQLYNLNIFSVGPGSIAGDKAKSYVSNQLTSKWSMSSCSLCLVCKPSTYFVSLYRKAGGQKLESLGDMLRTVADSLESTGNPNDAPPVNLYRVHVRMEKGSKKAAFNEMYPTLNYWYDFHLFVDMCPV